mmetsp:Transcript_30015/g.97728  ORF Transcript_30015/g.97728 Transcript_30015/m.97728 type:complete len:274 (+) Transcript_30015:2671-3492(+)
MQTSALVVELRVLNPARSGVVHRHVHHPCELRGRLELEPQILARARLFVLEVRPFAEEPERAALARARVVGRNPFRCGAHECGGAVKDPGLEQTARGREDDRVGIAPKHARVAQVPNDILHRGRKVHSHEDEFELNRVVHGRWMVRTPDGLSSARVGACELQFRLLRSDCPIEGGFDVQNHVRVSLFDDARRSRHDCDRDELVRGESAVRAIGAPPEVDQIPQGCVEPEGFDDAVPDQLRRRARLEMQLLSVLFNVGEFNMRAEAHRGPPSLA